MKLLKVIFIILWGLGYLGNGILVLYIEWSFLQQGFIQVFNPFLHFQVLGVLLTNPLFWIFLAMAVVGYYTATNIEAYLKKSAKRTKIDAEKVLSPSPQKSVPPKPLSKPVSEPKAEPVELQRSPSARSKQTYSSVPPQSPPSQSPAKPVSEPKNEPDDPRVKLLEWAIQSSQKVQFSYKNQNGEEGNFTTTPLGFKTIEKTLCLDGYCHLRRAKRTFEIRCIQDIRTISASQENYNNYNQAPINPAQQSLPSGVTQANNTVSQVKQRPYIKFQVDQLEKITNSGWNNTKILREIHYELTFRSRKRSLVLRKRVEARLAQLQSKRFSWPTTKANPGSENMPSNAFKYGEGLLKHYGYTVGMNGLSRSKRWEILDKIFLYSLLPMDNVTYLSEWGEPNSARRLQKLAESLAAFTRNAKRRKESDLRQAIQDWEADLAYLKKTYYDNRFSFQYPRT